MKFTVIAGAALIAMVSTQAMAVSVAQLISKCGGDAKTYCDGVGYGDPMQECLDKNFKKLTDDCKIVVQKLRDGEKVTLL
jgi:hypothetical protein